MDEREFPIDTFCGVYRSGISIGASFRVESQKNQPVMIKYHEKWRIIEGGPIEVNSEDEIINGRDPTEEEIRNLEEAIRSQNNTQRIRLDWTEKLEQRVIKK